jgi:hypothetical protein
MISRKQSYFRITGFFGLYPSCGIEKKTREHNVSETGSVFVLR